MDCALYQTEFVSRMAQIRGLVQATDPIPATAPTVNSPDLSREARGLSIVLLYAAYESLVKSVVAGLLETSTRLRVGNRRLQPAFRLAAVSSQLQSTIAKGHYNARPTDGLTIIATLDKTRECTVNTKWFPDDGSHMRRAQIVTICELFAIGDPGRILKGAWQRLDTIVDERNAIAHGQKRPEEIGRGYTKQEVLDLVTLWERRWLAFLKTVESKSSTRDFFRLRA